MKKALPVIFFLMLFSWALRVSADSADDLLGFANHLFEQQDFYRAITEYERFVYLYPESEKIPDVKYQIAMSYFHGQQFEPALTRFEALRGGKMDLQSTFRMADVYYEQGKYRNALLMLEPLKRQDETQAVQDMGHFYSGLCYLQLAEPGLAEQSFLNIPESSPKRREALALEKETENYHDLKQKKPWLAGTLSAVLPGAGQFYNERPRDAFFAFTLNAVLIWATVESFDNEQYVTGGLLGIIELGWYLGTVYNAVGGAHKYNDRQKKGFMEKIEMQYRKPFDDVYSEPVFSVHYRAEW